MALQVTDRLSIPEAEIVVTAVRSQGAGGQNVNKVSTAAHLFFDVPASTLPEPVKARLLARAGRRLTGAGVLVIKAQRHRTQEGNRADALERLRALVLAALAAPKPRRPTRPTAGSRSRRRLAKARTSRTKALRNRPGEDL